MFSIKIKITDKDLNQGNHVGNERALIFFQTAREKFLSSFGLSHEDTGEGVGLIQKDAYVDYKKQIFLNETIEVKISNISLKKTKILIEYEITSEDGNLLIIGYTTMVAFDYKLQKVGKYSSVLLEKINSFITEK